MDGRQVWIPEAMHRPAAAGRSCPPQSFLFLQGPISSFCDRLGRVLLARGHRVHRINLHFGDQLFWRLPAMHYRGRFEDWRAFVADFLDRHAVTDLILHGDRRPYHIVAAEEARARGIKVIATDLGYLRPDWLTLEYDGLTTYSRFPRDPDQIRALAAQMPEADLQPRYSTPFWLIAVLDVAYNLALVFGHPLFPHYRYHSTCHPFAEYAGWICSRLKELLSGCDATDVKSRLPASPGTYFLVPLQISTDFQIRAHSRFRDVREAACAIVASFAAGGSDRQLVFVAHPLDNGLVNWRHLIGDAARQHGIPGRVLVLPGGTPHDLLQNAAGVVTVNSTVGLTALSLGVPVMVLGNAVFDVAGLTCQSPLERFWHDPPVPDPVLVGAFLRALAGATQVKGGYYVRSAQDCAIAGFVERLEGGLYPLPSPEAAGLAVRPPRAATQRVALSSGTGPFGLALARAFAAPGIGLHLQDEKLFDYAVDDCRRRGAVVEAPGQRTAPDLFVVAAGGSAAGLLATMAAVGRIAPTMRLQRHGRLIVVAEASLWPAAARRSRATLLAYAAGLRRRLHDDGITLGLVVPSRFALAAAARLDDASIAAMSPDRTAEVARRLADSRRRIAAVPGIAVVAWRVLRLRVARLRRAARLLLPASAGLGEAAEEAPVPGDSGLGD